MMEFVFSVVVALLLSCPFSCARTVIKLNPETLELSLTSYAYCAVLFYDNTKVSQRLLTNWKLAANLLDDAYFEDDKEIGMVNAEDPGMDEITKMLEISHFPDVRVFRSGIMSNFYFYGDVSDAKSISASLLKDSHSSVGELTTLSKLTSVLKSPNRAIESTVFGLFSKEDTVKNDHRSDKMEYEVVPWYQFQSSADSLRGFSTFYSVSSEDMFPYFGVSNRTILPQLFIYIHSIADSPSHNAHLLKYINTAEKAHSNGLEWSDVADQSRGIFRSYDSSKYDILENFIQDWVLHSTSLTFRKLSFDSEKDIMISSHFFNSPTATKFILVFPVDADEEYGGLAASDQPSCAPDLAREDVLSALESISTQCMFGQSERTVTATAAVFAYMSVGPSVRSLLSKFGVNVNLRHPVLIADNPSTKIKYRSDPLNLSSASLANGNCVKSAKSKKRAREELGKRLMEFILAVSDGSAMQILRSESEILYAHEDAGVLFEGSSLDNSRHLSQHAHVQSLEGDKYAHRQLDYSYSSFDTLGLFPIRSDSCPTIATSATVIPLVSTVDKDVLLLVVHQVCENCIIAESTFDVLVRAVAHEPRILLVKIDTSFHDIPLSWNVTEYPTFLWFPAEAKPYASVGTSGDTSCQHDNNIPCIFNKVPSPQKYYKSLTSLLHIMRFIVNEGSFIQHESEPLSIASTNQLVMLAEFEDHQQDLYERIYMHQKRNHRIAHVHDARGIDASVKLQMRRHYDSAVWDALFGEVIFDGKRWHVIMFMLLCIQSIVVLGYTLWKLCINRGGSGATSVSSSTRKKREKVPNLPISPKSLGKPNALSSDRVEAFVLVDGDDDISPSSTNRKQNARSAMSRCSSNENVPALVLRATKRQPSST